MSRSLCFPLRASRLEPASRPAGRAPLLTAAIGLLLAFLLSAASWPAVAHSPEEAAVDGHSGATALMGGACPNPPGALRPLDVRDDHSNSVLSFTIDDVRKFHGHLGPVPVCAYRALQAASALLWAERPPRDDIRVVTTGPSNCVRDVFELIARADSRGDFEVRRPDDVETFKVPGPPTSRSCFVFEITQKSTGAQVRIQVREGVIPEEFFALARTAHSENPGPDAAEAAARFAGVKKALTETMASLPIAELFEWEIVRATQQGG